MRERWQLKKKNNWFGGCWFNLVKKYIVKLVFNMIHKIITIKKKCNNKMMGNIKAPIKQISNKPFSISIFHLLFS